MYRWYFSHTPPNPRLNNPRLLEDYIDWYLNVYLQEEHIFHSVMNAVMSLIFLLSYFLYPFSSILVHSTNDDNVMNRKYKMRCRPIRRHHQKEQPICLRLRRLPKTNSADILSHIRYFILFLQYNTKAKQTKQTIYHLAATDISRDPT